MEKKNHILGSMRLSKEMDELLKSVADKLGFKRTDLARLLLTKSLKELKADIQKHGLINLEFEIKRV